MWVVRANESHWAACMISMDVQEIEELQMRGDLGSAAEILAHEAVAEALK